MFLVLVLVILPLALIYYMAKQRFEYWDRHGFLSGPTAFPFGSLKGMGTEIPVFQGLQKYYEAFKGKTKTVGLYFFFSPTLMIMDLDLLKNIYIKDFTSFHDRGIYYNKEDDPLSANMLALEGQEWRDRRVKLSPIFTSGKMKMMFDMVDSIGDKFVKTIDKELKITKNLEMRPLLSRFSTDVISNVAFGLDSNCKFIRQIFNFISLKPILIPQSGLEDPNSEFYTQGQRLFNLSSFELMKLLFTSGYPGIAKRLHMVANPKEPCDFLRKVFVNTLKEREVNGVQRNDFVQLLLKLRETVSLSMDEMAAESFIFYTGGFETSSSTLTFCMYELALNPGIQQTLREEIQGGLKANDGKISYDLLFSYQYLDMVTKEALRKYPIVTAMLRKCTKEYQIPESDLVIPEGRNVLIPVYSIHHDPEHYPDPEKFDPLRFSPENSVDRDPMTFLAFGEGPRACVGSRFGMLQMKITLVKLLTNFKFTVCKETPIPLLYNPKAPFLAPIGNMCLQVEPLGQ